MATRNPNNTIDFGSANFGAPISHYTIDGGATLASETNPGEALEAIIETIQMMGTVVAIGAEDGAGAFRVAVENSGWIAANLQTAIRALGTAVGTNSYNASLATAVDFAY